MDDNKLPAPATTIEVYLHELVVQVSLLRDLLQAHVPAGVKTDEADTVQLREEAAPKRSRKKA